MKIYLDVDDTLAHFRKHAVARGVPNWEGSWYTTDPATWTAEQKAIQAATNAQMSMLDFWLTMPVDPEAFELIAAARLKAYNDVYLLTALPSFAKGDEALSTMIYGAKMEYATNVLHMPADRVVICARADKVHYASGLSRDGEYLTQNVLVDDAIQNCREWIDANGIAIYHDANNRLGMRETIRAVRAL